MVDLKLATQWCACMLLGLVLAAPAVAQSTMFTFQGVLEDSGVPASGNLQMTFTLYDTATVGTGTLKGTVGPLSVAVADGLFVAELDFGAAPFDGSTDLWLEIDVAGTTIGRQRLTATPFALYSRGPGMMIPFSSGQAFTLNTLADGSVDNAGLIGFGRSGTAAFELDGTINLTGAVKSGAFNAAFLVPQAVRLTSMSVYYNCVQDLSLVGTTVTVEAQLYQSSTPDNTFTAIPGTAIVLAPAFTGTVVAGTALTGSLSGLNIAITEHTRVALVFTATAAGASLENWIQGHASAGIMLK